MNATEDIDEWKKCLFAQKGSFIVIESKLESENFFWSFQDFKWKFCINITLGSAYNE